MGGAPFAYAWAPEWHKTHGLHLHFAVGRYVPRALIERAWGRGFIKIKLLGDLPVGAGALEEARKAGRYLAKYAGKDFGVPQKGLHRYEVAQGFQPVPEAVYGRTAGEAIAAAAERMGSPPSECWDSGQEKDWQGPPAVWVSWTG